MNIRNFVTTKSKVAEFEKQKEGKSKEEIRELETLMLTPERCTAYTGPLPKVSSLGDLKVTIVLPDKDTLETMGKYFKIATHGGNNIVDLSLLINLLNMLENEDLVYDKINKELSINGTRYTKKTHR